MIQYLHFQNVLIFWSLVFAVLNQKALFLFFLLKMRLLVSLMYKSDRTNSSISLIKHIFFLRNIFNKPLRVCAYIAFSLQTVLLVLSGRKALFDQVYCRSPGAEIHM